MGQWTWVKRPAGYIMWLPCLKREIHDLKRLPHLHQCPLLLLQPSRMNKNCPLYSYVLLPSLAWPPDIKVTLNFHCNLMGGPCLISRQGEIANSCYYPYFLEGKNKKLLTLWKSLRSLGHWLLTASSFQERSWQGPFGAMYYPREKSAEAQPRQGRKPWLCRSDTTPVKISHFQDVEESSQQKWNTKLCMVCKLWKKLVIFREAEKL